MDKNFADINDEGFNKDDLAEVDKLIEHMKSLPKASTYMFDEERLRQCRFAYAMICHLLKQTGSDATIYYGPHEPDIDVGVIRVEGVELTITDMEGFARVAEFADNMEVYPLVENKVRLEYMFYRIAKPIRWDRT
jgi:hypothetical protein